MPVQGVVGNNFDSPPPAKNMLLWVQPSIYPSDPEVEEQWREMLHQASLNLTRTLIKHYKKVIKNELDTLEKIKNEITDYLKQFTGTSREDR